jgi:predicted N-acetyltransferase YhbS
MLGVSAQHVCARDGEGAAMITIRHERAGDIAAREALLDEAFGETRYRKSSERLREGRAPAQGLAFIATDKGRVIGTARMWNVSCGENKSALLLGPVAVACDVQRRGIGAKLVERAITHARELGHAAVVLVGDVEYYGRFGFSAAKTSPLSMPGPYEPHRLLALELTPGALDDASGTIASTGPLLQPRRSRRRRAA